MDRPPHHSHHSVQRLRLGDIIRFGPRHVGINLQFVPIMVTHQVHGRVFHTSILSVQLAAELMASEKSRTSMWPRPTPISFSRTSPTPASAASCWAQLTPVVVAGNNWCTGKFDLQRERARHRSHGDNHERRPPPATADGGLRVLVSTGATSTVAASAPDEISPHGDV